MSKPPENGSHRPDHSPRTEFGWTPGPAESLNPRRDPSRELDPDALKQFGRLELIARLVVEGLMVGRHRSPFKGISVEFAEHRPYGAGDEIRHIDWRAFGKTDRYFVKQYEEETNLQAYLVLDTSASMAYRGRTLAKLEYARRLAASLSYLMIGQRDAVGLVTSDDQVDRWIPPRSTPGHFTVLCRALERAEPRGEPSPSQVLHRVAQYIRRRGLVIVLTDGFDELDHLARAVKHLRHRHHEVIFWQILAPEEEEFPFRQVTRFQSLEGPSRTLRVDPAAVAARYRQRIQRFCRDLADQLRSVDADYQKVSTETKPSLAIMEYLVSRSGGASRRDGVGAGPGRPTP